MELVGDYFLTVSLNPTLQKTVILKQFVENEENPSEAHFLDVAGKGVNPSRILVQLHEPVIHLTHAGGRSKGLFFSLVETDGITYRWVESNSEIRYCHTFLNLDKHTTTEIIEEAEPVDEATEQRYYREFEALLPGCHTLIIAGTKALGFSKDIYPAMVREAKRMNKTVILDLKGEDLQNCLEFRPDIIKPNLSEFVATFLPGLSLKEQEAQEEIVNLAQLKMMEIYRQSGTISVLTRGKYGVLFLNQGKIETMPARLIEPVNTIGCGDAFTAGFASVWNRDTDIKKAVQKGMECAEMNAVLVRPGRIF